MTARRTQAERVQASTDSLLRAAVELVAERGYAGASASAIAERAGLDRKMVHHRFGSKIGLFQAVLDEAFKRPLLSPLDDSALNGLQRAIRAMTAVKELGENEPAFLRAIFTIAFHAVGTSNELAETYQDWLTEVKGAGAQALRLGQADGSVDPVLDVDRVAQAGVDATTGLVFRWCLSPEIVDLAAELRAWIEHAQVMYSPQQ